MNEVTEMLTSFLKPIFREVVKEEVASLRPEPVVPEDIKEIEILRHREFLQPKEVEALYGLNHKTLASWRGQGRGPAYSKDGGLIFYRRLDIEAYLKNCRQRTIEQPGLK
ncbi:MAG: helix-turn-helix domain-containing protein [Candidatus Adiutrix sp.]|nr:helix-turn-helix domain-containing protein [Candidatus Adiutrix sp.]